MREFFRNHLLGLPPVASTHAEQVDDLVIYVHYLMAALFIGWSIFFIYTLIRFNQRNHPKADHLGVRSHASSYVEGLVALIEVVLLIGFAVPMWARNVDTFPNPKESTQIWIVAQQFNWNVFYAGPDGEFGKRDFALVTDDNPWGLDKTDPNGKDDLGPLNNIIHVPVNKPVLIKLTSKDVIHSFKVISMRVAQDAVPGLAIPVHFTPTKIGTYQINCAQLCGIGHSSMAGGRLIVESQEDYDKWFASQTKAAGTTAKSFD
jgi:cytochrome c oxidase subunit II